MVSTPPPDLPPLLLSADYSVPTTSQKKLHSGYHVSVLRFLPVSASYNPDPEYHFHTIHEDIPVPAWSLPLMIHRHNRHHYPAAISPDRHEIRKKQDPQRNSKNRSHTMLPYMAIRYFHFLPDHFPGMPG